MYWEFWMHQSNWALNKAHVTQPYLDIRWVTTISPFYLLSSLLPSSLAFKEHTGYSRPLILCDPNMDPPPQKEEISSLQPHSSDLASWRHYPRNKRHLHNNLIRVIATWNHSPSHSPRNKRLQHHNSMWLIARWSSYHRKRSHHHYSLI